MDLSELKQLLVAHGEAWDVFKAANESMLKNCVKKSDLEAALVDIERRWNREGGGRTTGGVSKEERKALDRIFRCWVGGDQAGVDGAVNELKGLVVGSDPAGGYFTLPQVGPMVTRLAEISPLIGLVQNIDLTAGDALEGVADLGLFEANWVGETQARPETAPSDLGKYRIELRELYAQPAISQKLIDVADFDVAAWAFGKIEASFAVKEEAAIVGGDGVMQPRGFTTMPTAAIADATRPWGAVEHVATGNAGDFASSNPGDTLIEITSRLRPIYRPNATWLMSRATGAKIRKFKGALSGDYLWQPGLQLGQPDRLLGYPVVYCEALPALTDGSLSVAFGDFRAAYTTIRKSGVRLFADPYTSKPHVRLYAYERVGGGVFDFNAIKLVRFASA